MLTNLHHTTMNPAICGPPLSYEAAVEAYASSHQSRRAIIDMTVGLSPGHFLTLNTNSNLPLDLITGQKRIDFFHHLLNRQMLGPRYFKKQTEELCHSISIPEGHRAYRDNYLVKLHYHALVCMAPNSVRITSLLEMEDMVAKLWRRSSPGGDADVQLIYDAAGAAGYATKYLSGDGAIAVSGYCLN